MNYLILLFVSSLSFAQNQGYTIKEEVIIYPSLSNLRPKVASIKKFEDSSNKIVLSDGLAYDSSDFGVLLYEYQKIRPGDTVTFRNLIGLPETAQVILLSEKYSLLETNQPWSPFNRTKEQFWIESEKLIFE